MLKKTIGRVVPPAGKEGLEFVKELDRAIDLVGPLIKALAKEDDTVEIVNVGGGMVEVLPRSLVVEEVTLVGKKLKEE